MKAITANRLEDGRVVYRDAKGGWTQHFEDAARYSDDALDGALDSALSEEGAVVGPYAIDVEGAALSGVKLRRESIRLFGPTAGSTREAAKQGADHVQI